MIPKSQIFGVLYVSLDETIVQTLLTRLDEAAHTTMQPIGDRKP